MDEESENIAMIVKDGNLIDRQVLANIVSRILRNLREEGFEDEKWEIGSIQGKVEKAVCGKYHQVKNKTTLP